MLFRIGYLVVIFFFLVYVFKRKFIYKRKGSKRVEFFYLYVFKVVGRYNKMFIFIVKLYFKNIFCKKIVFIEKIMICL